MGVWWDPKILSIVSDWFAITSFVFIVVVVGLILQHNLPTDEKNFLVKCKKRINSLVEPHKHLKWLQGDRAVEFSLLYIGITVGLCGLGLQLWLDYITLY